MPATARRVKLIEDPVPFGDVSLAPSAATGRSEAELAQSMAERLFAASPRSTAEAPKTLGGTFPDFPLTGSPPSPR